MLFNAPHLLVISRQDHEVVTAFNSRWICRQSQQQRRQLFYSKSSKRNSHQRHLARIGGISLLYAYLNLHYCASHSWLESPLSSVTNSSQLSALTGGSQPEFAGNLYTYLTQKPQYSTSESRKALVRRLREALVKCVSVMGICKPQGAIFSISAVEREEDKDYSCSRYVIISDWRQLSRD